MEYFCFQGDETWSLPDHALVELAVTTYGRVDVLFNLAGRQYFNWLEGVLAYHRRYLEVLQ